MGGSRYDRVFEVYRRDGHKKEKLFDAEDLEELAQLSAAKSGADRDPDGLFDFGRGGDGE